MKIIIIVAMDKNNAIGNKGKLLWHIPKDLQWLKTQTMGHVIVMGRNSYNDIITYTKGKPLIGRTNVVLTSKNSNFHSDFVVLNSIEDVLIKYSKEDKIFILGGGSIYKSFLPLADEVIITHVDAEFEADTFFPKFNYSEFKITFEEANKENGLNFKFVKYEKKKI